MMPIPTAENDESLDDEAAICSFLSRPLATLSEQLPVLKQVLHILQTKPQERREIPKRNLAILQC